MKVVIGVDGSENSFDAIEQAYHILSTDRDSLVLYCALPDVPVGIPAAQEAAEHGRTKLSQSILARARLHVPEVWRARYERVVGAEDPASGILNTAKEMRADLVVVGTRGLGGLGRLLVGSVSRKIVRGSAAPVLVARKRPHAREGGGLSVLLGCESVATGRQMAAVLNRFAWPSGTTGEVAHMVPSIFGGAIPDWLDAEARKPDVAETVKLWVRDHDRRLAAARDEMQALNHAFSSSIEMLPSTVAEGAPDVELLKLAQIRGSDLLVIGARTSTPLGRLLSGSTCESVLNHAHCSVLVIPHA